MPRSRTIVGFLYCSFGALASTTIQWTAHPDMCIDVDGNVGPAPPKPAKIFRCNGNENQNFNYNVDDMTIRWDTHPDICLEIVGASVVSGAAMQWNYCSKDGDSTPLWQQWAYDGGVGIASASTIDSRPALCASVKDFNPASGTDVQLVECSNPSQQSWTMHLPPPPPAQGPTPAPAPPAPTPAPPAPMPTPAPPAPIPTPAPPAPGPTPAPAPPAPTPPPPAPMPTPGGGGAPIPTPAPAAPIPSPASSTAIQWIYTSTDKVDAASTIVV